MSEFTEISYLDLDNLRKPYVPNSDKENLTPFKTFEEDSEWNNIAMANLENIVKRLGFPTVPVELSQDQIYTYLEEALLEFSSILNRYKIHESYFNLIGRKKSDITNFIKPHTGLSFSLSDSISDEVGLSGAKSWYRDKIRMIPDQQEYDLEEYFLAKGIGVNDFEIRFIYYNDNVDKYLKDGIEVDGYLATGLIPAPFVYNASPMYHNLGVISPLDILLSKSYRETRHLMFGYLKSYKLMGNKLRISPTPSASFDVYFEYKIKSDESKSMVIGDDEISSPENVPYNYIKWSGITDTYRSWIRNFALAITRESLGNIRNVFASLTTPNGEINLNGDQLINDGREDKEQLIERLREDLEKLQLSNKSEEQRSITENIKESQSMVPLSEFVTWG